MSDQNVPTTKELIQTVASAIQQSGVATAEEIQSKLEGGISKRCFEKVAGLLAANQMVITTPANNPDCAAQPLTNTKHIEAMNPFKFIKKFFREKRLKKLKTEPATSKGSLKELQDVIAQLDFWGKEEDRLHKESKIHLENGDTRQAIKSLEQTRVAARRFNQEAGRIKNNDMLNKEGREAYARLDANTVKTLTRLTKELKNKNERH